MGLKDDLFIKRLPNESVDDPDSWADFQAGKISLKQALLGERAAKPVEKKQPAPTPISDQEAAIKEMERKNHADLAKILKLLEEIKDATS